ncbi:MAG TPA: C40 family peptidase [Actinomycetes bacterium]
MSRGRRSLHLGAAASVAGTVAVTGTIVASAAPSGPKTSPMAFALTDADQTIGEERAAQQQADLRAQQLREKRANAAAAAAAAKARAAAARKAAAEKAAAAKAAAEKAAAEKAAAARQAAASRSDSRMSATAAHVLAIAAAQEGDSYVYGADGPDSFDCSGFTMYVFGKVGISLPHSSAAQADVARPVSTPQPGDLVFVHNGGGGSIGHVAIYAGDGYWYEASNPSTGVGKHKAWSTDVTYGRVL